MVLPAGKEFRGAWMVGNWKMAMPQRRSLQLASDIGLEIVKKDLNKQNRVRFGLAPSPMCIQPVIMALDGLHSNIMVGSQGFYAEKGKGGFVYEGAFTQETSLPQIRDAGARFSLLGHSETRDIEDYGVKGLRLTDAMLNERLRAGLAFLNENESLRDFFIIYCVGETLKQRDEGNTKSVLMEQIQEGFEGVSDGDMKRIVVAYEPVWAIGTGKTASKDEANHAAGYIRAYFKAIYSAGVAEGLRILYGGSMNPKNVAELMAQEYIDGGLIGGASLNVPDFLSILEQTSQIYNG